MIFSSVPLYLCDPVTLTAIGLGLTGAASAAGTAASLLGPKPKAPQTPVTPPSPAPIQQPVGQQQQSQAGAPSFLAAAAAPVAQQRGTKTLLGQ